jgi:hypothetical protein
MGATVFSAVSGSAHLNWGSGSGRPAYNGSGPYLDILVAVELKQNILLNRGSKALLRHRVELDRCLLGYLGYLVDDLHWSRWVLSGDVLAQCCLRPLLLVSLESLLSGCNHIISVPSVGIFKRCHRH